MAHLDASNAECLVFTYKEGLLSAVAHDLEIRVERFDLDVDDASLAVKARFDPTSLRVVAAVVGGAPNPATLSEGDRRKIEENIAGDVLHVLRHRTIEFTSTSVRPEGEGYRVEGDLALHGTTRPLSFVAKPAGDRVVAEISLHQPSFGIKPYSAMLGALKIKPEVLVRCSVARALVPAR
jgi:hypothetical protein